jgi:hypothetical protein
MMNISPEQVNEAILIWTGRIDGNGVPHHWDDKVLAHFGPEIGPAVLQQVQELSKTFFLSQAFARAPDLKSMGDMAADEFRSKHPEISDEAVAAFRWAYVFGYK